MQIRLQVNPLPAGGRNNEPAYDAGRDADGIDEATAGLEDTPVETTPPAPDPERPNQRRLNEDLEALDQIEQGGVVISRNRTARNQSAYTAMQNLQDVARELTRIKQDPSYYTDEQRAAVLEGMGNLLRHADSAIQDAMTGDGRLQAGDPVVLREEDYHLNDQGRRVRYDILGRETEQEVTPGMLRTTYNLLQRQLNRLLRPSHSGLRITGHIIRIEGRRGSFVVEPVTPTAVHSPTRVTPPPRQSDEARYVADLETAISNFYTYLRAAEQGGPRAQEWLGRAQGQSRTARIALGRLVEEHPDGSRPVQLSDGARVNIRELQGRVEVLDTDLGLARANQRRAVVQTTPPHVAPNSVQPQVLRPEPEQTTESAWSHVQMGYHNLDRATELRAGDVRRSALLQRANSDLEAAREALQRAREAGEPSTRCDQIQVRIDALARDISEALAPIF